MRPDRPTAARLAVPALGLAVIVGAGGVLPTVAPAPAYAAPAAGTYAIGDSVMVGAKANLRARGIRVNATVSRHFWDGDDVVRAVRSRGDLPRKVVVHLGTNTSGITLGQCRDIVSAAGPRRKVWLVTIRGVAWSKANNRVLRRCADRTSASLIPWKAHAKGQRRWFWDGAHLTPAGAAAYAAFIDRYV